MSQTYEQLVSGTTPWSQVYGKVNNMSEALRSAFSGTSFPTSPSPVAGQPCYRTDRLSSLGYPKKYIYTNNSALGESGWVEVSEGSPIGEEVKNSRGTKSTLDQRLDVAINEDGTLKAATTLNPSQWYKPSLTFTYISTTSFKVNGDQTDIYKSVRRLKINLTASVVYSEVVSATYSAPDTTVIITNAVLDNTLVDVEHSLFLPHKDSGAITKRMTDKVVALTDGATINTDTSAGNIFKVTLAGNRTLAAPTNPSTGQQCVWVFTQDGTGNRTITLNAVFRNLTGLSSITLSTAAGAVDYMIAVYNLEDTKWDVIGFVPLNISANDSIINKTANYTLVVADITGRTTFTNYGAADTQVNFTLPTATAGAITHFLISAETADTGGIKITAGASDVLNESGITTATGGNVQYKGYAAVGHVGGLMITAICYGNGIWTLSKKGAKEIAIFNDTKTAGSSGGTFTQGAWRTRVLNTTNKNTIKGASLASNQITLPAGTYIVRALAPARGVDSHQVKLYNITDSYNTILGREGYCSNTTQVVDGSTELTGSFSITAEKVFELQHYCSTTNADYGFGSGIVSFSVSIVFAIVEIERL